MLLIPAFALLLQSTSVTIGAPGVKVEREDGRDTTRREARRTPVTEEHRRTAFRDAPARDLLLRARLARMTQDSLLTSYDAMSYQRISAGMSLRETSRARLAFRTENASRVRWSRTSGVHAEVLGARAAIPFLGKDAQDEIRAETSDMLGIPYYPGKEQLWVGGGLAKAEVDEREIVHPLAEGSEAYYHYETGDSVIMTLPDGKRITLRELRITARVPKWNVIVGSFWFEVDRAHLVRAVYRFSVQMDIWKVANEESDPGDKPDEEVPFWVKPIITPMVADITSISVEYGLYDQRFWLPKVQGMDGFVRVSFMRIPITFQERFRYESVNGLDSLPAIVVTNVQTSSEHQDSLVKAGIKGDSLSRLMQEFRARRDTVAAEQKRAQCASGESYTKTSTMNDGTLAIATQLPCDSTKLATSRELPGSIYDDGEELFGTRDVEELRKALTMGLQPGWVPQAPSYEYGLAHTRFNRIEGLSTGGAVKFTLGNGYTAQVGLRGSVADAQLNGDLGLTRSNGRSELRANLYRRLAVSSDFGDPLSFGSSVASLLYARDEGFYHRAWGGELGGRRPMLGGVDWRLFAEQQWNASVENRWSLFGGANDDRFLANVPADEGWVYGAAARWRGSRGLDPNGWRISSDIRLEGATGDFEYGRGLFETTVSRGLGPVAASLTGTAGTSVGELPAQRHFFLGGLQTIRGQTAGTGFGEAFWMTRLEIGGSNAGYRPVLFGDLGWAGARDAWSDVGRPMSGVGVGASFLDGMIRLDLARGMHPRWQTRLDMYLEARF